MVKKNKANGKNQEKLTVWLSKDLKKKLDLIIEIEGYGTYAEYVRSCIRRDFEKIAEKRRVIING